MIRARVLRALPATLLVHAVHSACALALALPLASGVPSASSPEAPAVAALASVIQLADALRAHGARYVALPLALTWLLTPFLRMIWFRAQWLRAPLHEHAQLAARRYLKGLAVGSMSVALQALCAAAAWAAGSAGAYLAASSHDERLQAGVALIMSAPFALSALIAVPTLGDLAYVRLACAPASVRSAVASAWTQLGARPLLVRAACACAIGGVLLASLLPRTWLGAGVAASWWLGGLSQASALLQTGVRAYWCAWLADWSAAHGDTLEPMRSDAAAADVAASTPAAAGVTAAADTST